MSVVISSFNLASLTKRLTPEQLAAAQVCAVRHEDGQLFFDAKSVCYAELERDLLGGNFRPGDVVSIVLRAMGYAKDGACGCAEFKTWMNELGWLGCWRRKEEILKWFEVKAKSAGLDTSSLDKLVSSELGRQVTRVFVK